MIALTSIFGVGTSRAEEITRAGRPARRGTPHGMAKSYPWWKPVPSHRESST